MDCPITARFDGTDTALAYSASVFGTFVGLTTVSFASGRLAATHSAWLVNVYYACGVAQLSVLGVWLVPILAVHAVDLYDCAGKPVFFAARQNLLFGSLPLAIAGTLLVLTLALRSAGPRGRNGYGTVKASRPALGQASARSEGWLARMGRLHLLRRRVHTPWAFFAAVLVLTASFLAVHVMTMLSLVGPFAIALSLRSLVGQAFGGLLAGSITLYLCIEFTPMGSVRQLYGRILAAMLFGAVVTIQHFVGYVAAEFAPAHAGKTWEQIQEGQGSLLQIAAVAQRDEQRSWTSILIGIAIFHFLLLLGHMLMVRF